MAMDNTTTLSGNCGNPPELRYTQSGKAVASFGMALSRRWKDAQDEWQEATSWVDVTAWDDLASNVADSVGKGTRVTVTGRIQQESWEAKDGSGTRSKLMVVADDVAVSLRWATADVTRNERSEGGGERQPATTGGGPAPTSSDEEPF